MLAAANNNIVIDVNSNTANIIEKVIPFKAAYVKNIIPAVIGEHFLITKENINTTASSAKSRTLNIPPFIMLTYIPDEYTNQEIRPVIRSPINIHSNVFIKTLLLVVITLFDSNSFSIIPLQIIYIILHIKE
jgi:hypothetical protein